MAYQPKRRIAVESGLSPEEYAPRPVASPVDSYVRPADGAMLQQLAGALGNLAPKLNAIAGQVGERKSAEAKERGVAKARELQEAKLTYEQAVKKGVIEPQQNPWFYVGLKEQFGRLAAAEYKRNLVVAAASDEKLKSSLDPSDFGKFAADQRASFLKEYAGDNDDLHFQRGFGNLADAYEMDVGNAVSADMARRAQAMAGENVYSEVFDILTEHANDPRELRLEAIQQVHKNYLGMNPKGGRTANLATIEAIQVAAEASALRGDREGALEILGLLKDISAGPGGKLAGTREAGEAFLNASRNINRDIEAGLSLDASLERKAQKVAEEGLLTRLNTAIDVAAAEGTLDTLDVQAFVMEARKIDPEKGDQLVHTLLENRKKAAWTGNDELFRDLLTRVYGLSPKGTVGLREITRHYRSDGGLNHQQYSFLVNQVQELSDRAERKRADKTGAASILDDKDFTFWKGSLEGRFQMAEDDDIPDNIRQMKQDATGLFLQRYIQWKGANPEATPAQAATELERLSLQVYLDVTGRDPAVAQSRQGTLAESRGLKTSTGSPNIPALQNQVFGPVSDTQVLDVWTLREIQVEYDRAMRLKKPLPDRLKETLRRVGVRSMSQVPAFLEQQWALPPAPKDAERLRP